MGGCVGFWVETRGTEGTEKGMIGGVGVVVCWTEKELVFTKDLDE